MSLGPPSVKQPPPVLAPRRKTRKVKLGYLYVGGDAPDHGAVDDHHPDA